ncbi:MAG: outer membrane beta-barrel protein [Candidatus Omnitrophota bacterium]|nr:MAG: outer membrane beta-barrel protein [Candidatus Omnitrophota bacterium]
MKKLISLTLFLSIIFLANTAFALEIWDLGMKDRYAIGFRYYYDDVDDEDFKRDGNVYSANLTYSLNSNFALELETGHVKLKSKFGTELGVFATYLNLQIRKPIENWAPYLVGGIGGQFYDYGELKVTDKKDKSADFSYKVGAGLEYAFDKNWAMNVEYVYVYGNTGGSASLDTYGWQYGAGIKYYFD